MVDLNDNVKLIRMEMKGNLIVSNRDLCVIRVRTELANGSILILQTSVEDSRIPETKCVRAEAIITATLLEDVEGGCKVTSIQNMDPKGSIPTSFVNMMAGKQHDQYVALKKKMES